MAEKTTTAAVEPKKSGSGKKTLLVLLLLLVCCGVCGILFVALMVLGVDEAKKNSDEIQDRAEELEEELEDIENEEATATDIATLSKCDGTYQGDKVSVEGYFQTPFSVFCFGTCSLDFAGKFDAPKDGPKITASVDYTKTDGANTVTFPDSYTDITDFTFLDDANNKLNASKAIKLTGTWQVTDNSDEGTANTCKLSVDEMVQVQ